MTLQNRSTPKVISITQGLAVGIFGNTVSPKENPAITEHPNKIPISLF